MKTILFIILFLHFPFLKANNVKIENLQVSEKNLVHFSLSWENSWNLVNEKPNNQDAVWVFFKIREKNDQWKPLDLYNAYSFQSENSVFSIEQSTNSKGLMFSPTQIGNFYYVSDSIQFYIENLPIEFELKAFAIEMVYVPKSPYYLGDGISLNSLSTCLDSGYISIQNEDAIHFCARNQDTIHYFVPQAYPKGYNSFYAMKYEISQQQYLDFLNCLSFIQQENRTSYSPDKSQGTSIMSNALDSRNGLQISVSGIRDIKPAVFECNANSNLPFSSLDDAQNRAMNYLNWEDLAAYLDWAGLRPLTELEYEKLCRGIEKPTEGEFAWGTIYSRNAIHVLNDGYENETVLESGNDTTGLANHGYDGVQGVLRSGFAASSTTSRVSAGASYYGAFDLSGNLWEQFISANNVAFEGEAGDGLLDSDGNADSFSWPNGEGDGTIYRGGAWNSGVYEVGNWRDLAISDRYYFYLATNNRRNTSGGRGGISW